MVARFFHRTFPFCWAHSSAEVPSHATFKSFAVDDKGAAWRTVAR